MFLMPQLFGATEEHAKQTGQACSYCRLDPGGSGELHPCNVIVQEISGGRVEVAAIDPVASMQAVENPALMEVASEIRAKLKEVIDRI